MDKELLIKNIKEVIGGSMLAIAIPLLTIFLISITILWLATIPPTIFLVEGIAICILMILGGYFLLREKKEDKPKRFKLRMRYLWIAIILYNLCMYGIIGMCDYFREYPLTFFVKPLILFLVCKISIYFGYKLYDLVTKKPLEG